MAIQTVLYCSAIIGSVLNLYVHGALISENKVDLCSCFGDNKTTRHFSCPRVQRSCWATNINKTGKHVYSPTIYFQGVLIYAKLICFLGYCFILLLQF